MNVDIVRTVKDVRERVDRLKSNGKTVALVPTMGGLHEGHLSLITRAREVADHVVVSIFVNPKQFNNPDDLESYPGNEKADLLGIEKMGADIAFIPGVSEMYPQDFATEVKVTAGTGILCDVHRPGHFSGMATVVAKLFLQVGAHYACFGEKDYQQLFIIKRLVTDLNIPVTIIAAPTIREPDGLAMSSRNALLGKDSRKIAPRLQQAMQAARAAILKDGSAKKACEIAWKSLEHDDQFQVEYLEMRCGESMQPMDRPGSACRLFAAAWLDGVRLIDNIKI